MSRAAATTGKVLTGLRRAVTRGTRAGVERMEEQVGGPARLRVVLLLASILSLDSADQGAIGAVAPQLESSLHISNVELGLLVTVTAVLGGAATIPMGMLVDRVSRVRLMALVILCWGLAEGLSGAAPSYPALLGIRLALAAVTAAAAPAVASLTGDLVPPNQRGRVYGFIVTGEILGAGFGVLVAGLLAGWFGWRPALSILALPSLALSYFLIRLLPEPVRGGRSWIGEGAETIEAAPASTPADGAAPEEGAEPSGESERLLEVVEEEGVEPAGEIVVDEDPRRWNLRRAVRYVLSVRTNVVLIISSSVGYFFFAGLKTFALLFVRGQYSVSQGLATVLVLVVGAGAVAGVVLAGRTSDRLIDRHWLTARVDVGVVGYAVGGLLLIPALVTSDLPLAVPLIVLAAAGIAAPNGTLDAARLDVVPSALWGRAEAVRTVVRSFLEAGAPLAFGLLSEAFGSSKTGFGAEVSGATSAPGTPAQVTGLRDAFLIMLVPLVASGLVLLLARRSYPVDVASAAASERRIKDDAER